MPVRFRKSKDTCRLVAGELRIDKYFVVIARFAKMPRKIAGKFIGTLLYVRSRV